eukprot:5915216-Prorocentrum_lima.AAC.1
MTSSLVGSEMCIRDRGFLKASTIFFTIHVDPSIITSPTYTMKKPITSLPVSYTHLTLPTICSV